MPVLTPLVLLKSPSSRSYSSSNFRKRAIPGVNTDIYHQGFFEDKTNHYTVAHKQETSFTPFTDSLLWFGCAVGCLSVLLALAFCLREYIYNFKNRQREEYMNENKLDYYWSEEAGKPEEDQMKEAVVEVGINKWSRVSVSPSEPETAHLKEPSATFLTALEDVNAFHANDEPFMMKPILDKQSMLEKKPTLELHCIDGNSSHNSGNTFFNYTGVVGDMATPRKKVYKTKNLMNMRPKVPAPGLVVRLELDDFSTKKGSKIIKSWIRSPIFPVEHTVFYSSWRAEKSIEKVEAHLIKQSSSPVLTHDNVTRKIMTIKLLAIGANRSLHNPNIFLKKFTSTIDNIIDSGLIFDLMRESNDVVAQSLIDLVISYTWSHWQYRKHPQPKIESQFKLWKYSELSVQPHHVLFGHLCSIELGIYNSCRLSVDVIHNCETKIVSLMNYMIVNSYCNDYTGFIPIIADATEFTERVTSQRMFYNLALALISHHKDCCMNEYLYEDQNYLKPFVQHGFWIQNDTQVRKIAENIHMIIVKKYPQTMSWWNEIDGGRKYVASSARNEEKNEMQVLHKLDRLKILQNESKEQSDSENATIYEPSVPGSFNF